MTLIRDDEGYMCVKRPSGDRDWWLIVDRYGRLVAGEARTTDYGESRRRADEMNDDVIARRLADSMARKR